MKRYKKLILLAAFFLLSISSLTGEETKQIPLEEPKKIMFAVYIDNSDYAAARESFKEAFLKEARKKGIAVKFSFLNTIGSKAAFLIALKEKEPTIDMFFVTGTPNCLAVKEAGIKKPVIFAAVADPVSAKLVQSLENPGTNFTGSHCFVPIDAQVKALLAILPNIKKIGVFYNPHDPAPVSQAEKWKEEIQRLGLQSSEYQIPKEAESVSALADVARQMIGNVDVIVTTADAKVASYGLGVIAVALKNRIPIYATLNSQVKEGSFLSLGFDFEKGSEILVPLALDILQGKSPANIPVITYDQYKMVVNTNTAGLLNIKIPDKIMDNTIEKIQ